MTLSEYRGVGISAGVDAVHAGGEDQEGSCGADEEGVDVDSHCLHEALGGGVLDLGCGGGVGAGALACFVGVDTALDAPLDSGADDGAEGCFETEGGGDDELEDPTDLVEVNEEGDDGGNDVDDCHDGHYDGGEVSNALDAADDDESQDDGNADGAHPGVDGWEGVLKAGGDTVCLDAGQEEAAGEDGGEGEEGRVDLEETGVLSVAVCLFEVVGGATAVFAGGAVTFLVKLAEGGLDEGGGGAEEGYESHPEDSAGAAEGDGGGDACDVAGAYAACQ